MKSDFLFATQIYQDKLTTSKSELKSILNDIQIECVQIKNMDAVGRLWSQTNYINGYTSYSSQDQLHKLSSTFAHVEKLIQKHVQKYLKKLDYDVSAQDLKMTDFWVNMMSKNTIHTAHIHPRSVISGTFYVSVPKNSSGIKFHDPRISLFMNAPQQVTTVRKQNQRFVTLQPTVGDIVLFESWLMHEVPLNISKEPRISVSFNYDWK